MKINTRIIALITTIAMTIALAIPVSTLIANAASTTNSTQYFSDVAPDAWYADAVNQMAAAGILNGYPDGTFRPNQPMTAGEFATVLWNLTYGDLCNASELTLYVGVSSSDLWNRDATGTINPNHTDYQNFEKVGHLVETLSYPRIEITTWDGPVSAAMYGAGSATGGNTGYGASTTLSAICYYRNVGSSKPYYGNSLTARKVSRNIDPVDVANMTKDYVTRGFAISELVNVLRETNNLIYYSKPNAVKYATGDAIPDWNDITNFYHDICAGLDSSSSNREWYQYTSNWNYNANPNGTVISGGFANTWFSEDILLAYQYGLIQGKDSTGRCAVGSYMTRAEVCQMLVNADVMNTLYKYGNRSTENICFMFKRDGNAYNGTLIDSKKTSRIVYVGPYDPTIMRTGNVNYVNTHKVYYDGIDIRQQEWPTHPEFWKFRNGK